MSDFLPVTLDDEIACVAREVKMRERVYPRWVASKKMIQDKADREIKVMQSVLETLHRMKDLER